MDERRWEKSRQPSAFKLARDLGLRVSQGGRRLDEGQGDGGLSALCKIGRPAGGSSF